MKTDKIILLFVLIIIIIFLSYMEANILKITKGEPNQNKIMKVLKSMETNIRIMSFVSIAVLFLIFLFFILELRKGIKKGEEHKIDPFIGIFEKYQTDKKILQEEREKALLEIKEAKSMYDMLFNNSYLGILLIDEYSRIINANSVAKKILNNGDDFPQLVSIKDIENIKIITELYDKFIKDKENYFEKEIDINNNILNLSFFKNKKGKTSVLIRDITELKRAERAMEVKKQEEILGEMASYLSHEIKNSLGIIIGYMGMLKKTGKSENIDKAMDESKKLLKMLEDYLSLSKTVDKNMEVLNLYKLLKDSFTGIELSLKIDESLKNVFIKGDKNMLDRVFFNLYKNSEQAEASEVTITKITETDEFIRIGFKDDGSGIKAEYKNKIFLPFFSTKDSGSGMGLALVKKFLNDCEGDIKIGNSDTGTLFFIDLKKQIV